MPPHQMDGLKNSERIQFETNATSYAICHEDVLKSKASVNSKDGMQDSKDGMRDFKPICDFFTVQHHQFSGIKYAISLAAFHSLIVRERKITASYMYVQYFIYEILYIHSPYWANSGDVYMHCYGKMLFVANTVNTVHK